MHDLVLLGENLFIKSLITVILFIRDVQEKVAYLGFEHLRQLGENYHSLPLG